MENNNATRDKFVDLLKETSNAKDNKAKSIAFTKLMLLAKKHKEKDVVK